MSAPDSKQEPVAPFEPPSAEKTTTVYVDAEGHLVDDPWATLGLDRDDERDVDAIRAAWVEKIQAHPPEEDPEGARAVRDARERLLSDDRRLERLLGTLHVPSAEAWDLPTDVPDALVSDGPSRDEVLSARRRILGQAVLYTLVEDSLLKAQRSGSG